MCVREIELYFIRLKCMTLALRLQLCAHLSCVCLTLVCPWRTAAIIFLQDLKRTVSYVLHISVRELSHPGLHL